tara:strand:+ start:116345 stop:118351 length:2007 start_codon:yes stop_codon:yes gene_type:complete
MNFLKEFPVFKNPILFGLTVFLLTIILTQYLTYQRYLILKNKESQEIISQANWVEKEFQKIINQSFTTTQSLAFIVERYGVPKDFDSIAELLLQTNEHINALELVNGNGVITHVYPLQENEVLGFNILTDSIGKEGAITTIKRKDYFLTGPIHLKQGGDGFVSRIPIFKGSTFNGFSAAVIKLPDFLNSIHIDSIAENHFSYQLSKINSDKSEEVFLSQNGANPLKEAYNIPISIPKGELKLYVISNNKITYLSVAIFSFLGIILSVLAGVFSWFLLRQPSRLDKMVKEKTALLFESEEKFYKSFQSNLIGMLIVDNDLKIVEINEAFAAALNSDRKALYGKTIVETGVINFNTNNDIKKREELWLKVKERGKVSNEEIIYTLKNGKKIAALLSIECLMIKNEDHFLISAIDNTKKKEAEQKLEAQNIELKKTNEELDRFVYSASHELRAPLSSILGLLHIILSEEKEAGLVFKLKMMEQSITRLDGFIKDIVQYSQNKHLEIESKKINFKAIINDSIESLWYLENRDKVNIQFNVLKEAPFFSDKKRIAVVFDNLISNAIKYHNIENNNPIIDINIRISVDNAYITIKDNGVGIPTKHLDKIFNMFYRVSSKIMGTGIGLFVVKEIITKLNGKINIESEVNKGTKFLIVLPNQTKNDDHETKTNTIN